jgi:hypothetical protein
MSRIRVALTAIRHQQSFRDVTFIQRFLFYA